MGDKTGHAGLSVKAEKKAMEIITDTFGVEKGKVTPQADFVNDFSADSLDLTELIVKLQRAFDIEISDEEAMKMRTYQDVVDYLAIKLK